MADTNIGIDLDEARALVADCATYNFGMRNADRLAHDVAPALISELEEAREVLAGADHTAAKYWRRMTEAERERGELADHLVKTGEDADRYMEERDEALAVIERALENPLRMTAGVQAILQSAPADALRAVKAEVWDEGFQDCVEWWEIHHAQNVASDRNPYREPKEQD